MGTGGFLGLSISLSGLFANQRSLGVVSHNIANANTPGYSRQVMNTQAYRPSVLPGGMGTLGNGVDVTAVKQIRDLYLDKKYRVSNSELGEWQAKTGVLQQIESIFNEPSDTSLSKLLDNYYSALQSLSENPEDLTSRTLVRQTTISLTEGIESVADNLKALQSDLNFQFQADVVAVNNYANQIARLNKIIYESELEGGTANDVRDQRNLIVDKLSELVPVDYEDDSQGRFHLYIGGHSLVSHYNVSKLELTKRDNLVNDVDAAGLYDVQWDDGNRLNAKTGEIAGLLSVRDGVSGEEKGVPYYLNRLNDFVDTFADTMNNIHEGGYGLNSSTGYYMYTMNNMTTSEFKNYLLTQGLNKGPAVDVTSSILTGTTGLDESEKNAKIKANIDKLLSNNPNYSNKSVKLIDDKYYITDRISATDLTISADLEDLDNLAAASDPSEIPGQASNILDMIATRYDMDMYNWGAPEDFINSLVSNLGVDTQQAENKLENQKTMLNEYDTYRSSMMDVSLDEEMSNMIKFQTAYNANARMINVFDEMLDLIVNRLGTSGR